MKTATGPARAGLEPPPPGRAPARRWTFAVLGMTLAVAGWLRFANLDALSFWADEYPHAIAARSLIETRKPVLPSGNEYRRALGHTVVVAASMRAFGENEAAARIPSAIVGVLTVAAVWFATRRRFGEGAGLAAAAVMAVMPLHVAHSRSARFYAAFALAYGAAAVLGTRALETRSRRIALWAFAAFGVALHLQIQAATLLLPLICYALYLWSTAPEHHGSLRRVAAGLAGAGVAAGLVIALVPPLREGATWLIDHLPGLELKPGIHLDTLGKVFGVVEWWAWVALAPAAIAALRRHGRDGVALAMHLLVPALALAILFKPTTERGISTRYLFYLFPFLAALVGLAAAEAVRFLAATARRAGVKPAAVAVVATLVATASVAGVAGVWKIPGQAHPGRLIPRPNWNAATSVVLARQRPGDAVLSTSPLAPAWKLGRCADWIRETSAAETFLEDGRDIYCASELVHDAAALRAYLDAHPRGWLIADPSQWISIVDPESKTLMERTATPVDVGDDTILVMRWGA